MAQHTERNSVGATFEIIDDFLNAYTEPAEGAEEERKLNNVTTSNQQPLVTAETKDNATLPATNSPSPTPTPLPESRETAASSPNAEQNNTTPSLTTDTSTASQPASSPNTTAVTPSYPSADGSIAIPTPSVVHAATEPPTPKHVPQTVTHNVSAPSQVVSVEHRFTVPPPVSPQHAASVEKWKKKREKFKNIMVKFVKSRPSKEDLVQNRVLKSEYAPIPLKYNIVDELCNHLEKTGTHL